MPHLRARGLNKEELIDMSGKLIDELSEVMNSDKSTFTLEHIPSTYIRAREEVIAKHIFVEMLWFDRGEKMKEKVANTITNLLSESGGRDVAVYFIDMKKSNYYKNGVHF